MASFPPEPSTPSQEGGTPEPTGGEPRLLTRRDRNSASDGTSLPERVPGPAPVAYRDEPSRKPSRRSFRPLRSLENVRARIASRRRTAIEASSQPQVRQERSTSRRRPFLVRTIRRMLAVFAALAIAGCLGLLAFALFMRHDMRVALPQLDGDLHLAGLTAPVTVTRDAQGVPTLQAATLSDLLFAQGFVTAQDRLWQMDALRRHAAGELAEILGPSMLEHDRQQRTLQLRAAADRAILILPTDQLAQLQAYARGVNAFLEQNADRLPVEFHLLHYKPVPWSPRDTLLVSLAMFQDLGTSFPSKLHREALARHLPPELLADLYPTRSWRDQPPTQPPPDLTTPVPEVIQIPLDDSQVKLHQPRTVGSDLLAQMSATLPRFLGAPGPGSPAGALARWGGDSDFRTRVLSDASATCPECRAGSNNWAVSGRHTASGKPLVSNDMHLGLSVPDIWYEAGLHTTGSSTEPPLDVTGFTLPGAPFVIVGRNAHVAWSVTNLGADVQDIHIEHLRGSGDNTEFQQPDSSWAPVAHHRELIRVRGGHDQVLDVVTTSTHIGNTAVDTPIISPLYPGEHRALSLLWTPYDPHNLSSPFLAVNTAPSGSGMVASLAAFGGPALNLVYADDAGHIGYHAIGRIPIRGPAVHHPRALQPQLQPSDGAAPADEEPAGETPDETAKPSARLGMLSPHFLEAGYVVRRQRRSRREQKPARVPLRKAEPKPLPEAPIAPAPPARDYNIGSPLPSAPVDALDTTTQWSGYVPFEELPAVVDPADGILATANNRITPDDYPYFLAAEWAPPYRVERIRKLLAGRSGLTPADMLHIETDTVSAFDRVLGERLTYAIDHASGDALGKNAKRLHQAGDQLRNWSGGTPGHVTVDSPAAAIVSATRGTIWSMLLTPQIARHDHLAPGDSSLPKLAALYQWESQTVALESLLTSQPARWLPPGFASWNDFLAAAVARSLAEKGAPHDLGRWTYGSIHAVDIEHPVFTISPLLPRLLGAHTGTGAQPIGGDGTTIQATARAFGPSERFTADLGDPAATTANITTGQSGNPASPQYLDQFPSWLHGSTFALPLTGAPAQHTLRLLP